MNKTRLTIEILKIVSILLLTVAVAVNAFKKNDNRPRLAEREFRIRQPGRSFVGQNRAEGMIRQRRMRQTEDRKN